MTGDQDLDDEIAMRFTASGGMWWSRPYIRSAWLCRCRKHLYTSGSVFRLAGHRLTFTDLLLEKAQVSLTPGPVFGMMGRVISACLSPNRSSG